MKTKLAIGSGLLALVVIAVGVGLSFVPTRVSAPVTSEGVQEVKSDEVISTTTPQKRVEPFTATFDEVLASGNDYGCHYTSPEGQEEFTGTIYVSKGRARGTIIGNVFNAPGSMVSFLFNEKHTYLWFTSDAVTTYNGGSLLIEATTTRGIAETRHDVAKNLYDLYGCVSWEFEESFFELPTDIEFARP